MKRFALGGLLLALCTFAVNAQTPLYPSTYHVSALPSAATMRGRVVNVDDGVDGTDCTVGGGTANHACRSDGSIWAPWGDGNVIGSGVVVSVGGTSPINSSGGTSPTISINNSAADGTTKGAASFTAADFNSSSGNISIDYTNGQAADASHKGFLTSTDWSTFNGKEAAGIDLRIASNLSDLANAGTARGNLGGTTLGQNLFTLTNPSAVTWLRVNADNSVSTRSAAQTLSDIGAQASGNYLVDCGSNGFLARSALNTTVCRTLTATSNRLTITNTTGGGDPVFNVPDSAQLNVAKLVNLTTNGPIYVSGGDGTLNSEAVLNSTRGGTGVNNAGTLTNGSNTTITGGGTLALGGFTFTVPASGTGVLTSRTLTAGAGLTGGGDLSADRTFNIGAGNGITVNADDVALTTPGTLTVSSSNSASGSHTHAITSSSNPGAAASLLATDSSGYLTTVRHTVTDYLFVNNSTANLYLKDTSTGWQASSTTVINPQSGNSIRSTSFTSGLSGWGINAAGDAEFNNVTTRGELRASVFKVNEIAATAGTFGVFYSASTLNADATTPSIASSFTFDAKNSDSGGMLFGGGEVVRFKAYISPSGTIIGDAWATITGRSNHTTYATYTATMNSGSNPVVFKAGTAVVDYGVSGAGFITLSADGTVGSSPNLTMGTHAGSPWSAQTTLLRLGNLNGSYGYSADTYGFAAGDNSTAWVKIDPTNGVRLGYNSTTKVSIDTSGNASFAGSITASGGTIGGLNIASNKIYAGTGTFNNTNTAFYLDVDGSLSLKDKLSWNGTTLTITGAITSTSGAIGGFTIGSTSLSAGSGSTTVALDSGGTNPAFYAGSATPGSAPFRVTNAGALTATNATITGAITATSGAITGTLTMSGSGSAIAIGSTPPTSASAGTGIWLDRTGMYGLSSGTVQTKFDAATGAITAASGDVVLDSLGVTFKASGRILFNAGTTPGGKILSGPGAVELRALGSSGVNAFSYLSAISPDGSSHSPTISVGSLDSTSHVNFYDASGTFGGVVIGATDQDSTPNALLDVLGTVVFKNVSNSTTAYQFKNSSGTTQFDFDTSNARFGIGTSSPSSPLSITVTSAARTIDIGGSGTGFSYARLTNTAGELWWGLEGSAGGDLIGGTSGYDAIIGSVANKNFHLVSNSAVRLTVKNDGGIVVGSPTGGSKGAGTINATAVYDDNVLLTDWVFDRYYALPGSLPRRAEISATLDLSERRLFDLSETRSFTITEHRLPWMPKPVEFETERKLGGMVTRLWQGQEQQQLYIFKLEDTINVLNSRLSALEAKNK